MKKRIVYFSVLFVVIIAMIIGTSWANRRKIYTTTDIATYTKKEKDLYLIPDYNDALMVFPDSINDNMVVNDYYRIKVKQGFTTVGFHKVLDITYSSDAYNSEIQRLEGWRREYRYNNTQGSAGFLYDENNFEYPAFVAAYNCVIEYEYALILGNYRILYVYIRAIHKGESPLLDEQLPKNYFEKNLSLDGFSYSIYHNQYMWEYDNP